MALIHALRKPTSRDWRKMIVVGMAAWQEGILTQCGHPPVCSAVTGRDSSLTVCGNLRSRVT